MKLCISEFYKNTQLAYICEEICEETGGHGKFTKSMTPCIINWWSYRKHFEICIHDILIDF